MESTERAWLWTGRPWGWALLWMCFLVPMFFGTYIATLEITSWRSSVPVIVFDWEKHIPFIAWTVVPYWSIDLFYGLSLFLCASRAELDMHARRLVTAQAVAIPIFLLFPLKLVSKIPEDTGIFAPFFGALDDMVGKPYNLAPSLHIALLVILWVRYLRHVPWWLRGVVHVWSALIGISVMTAYQHHFFDVPTGAMLGFFCLWLWPESGPSPVASAALAADPQRWRLAGRYAVTSLSLFVFAWWASGTALWLLWPAQSLLFVALAYAWVGERLFQKDESGQMSLAARALLWPYLAGTRVNAALWTYGLPESALVLAPVQIGSLPSRPPPATAVLDLTAEIPAPEGALDWYCVPSLDLVVLSPDRLRDVAHHIERLAQRESKQGGAVLVCCALGFARSAAAIATWLVGFGHAADVSAALVMLRAARPEIVLDSNDCRAIEAAVQLICEGRQGDGASGRPGGRDGTTRGTRIGAQPSARTSGGPPR